MANTQPDHGSRAPSMHGHKKTMFSTPFVVVAVMVALIIGFIGGTRGTELLLFVGNNLGVEVRTDELDLSSLQETYRKLSAKFDGQLDSDKLVEAANKGLVSAAGDDYTQ